MNNKLPEKHKLINYWVTGANDDHETMMAMFQSKRFHWALFAGHLVIEKLLKAYFVYINDLYPPYTHNLLKLAEDCKIDIDEDMKTKLATITAFNINARYDDYKRSFYKRCTPDFTEKWINNIIDIEKWIKKQII